jgi:general secretion pathway protein G
MKQKEYTRAMPAGRQGFTLIELLIVIIILGVLATIGVTAFISSQKKGRDTTRKEHLRSIAGALELYYNDKGKYPLDDNTGHIVGCNGVTFPVVCTVNQPVSDNNGTIYMTQLPTDPASTQYYYYVSRTGAQFQLYARLENADDPRIIVPAAASTCGSGSLACNYGISSGNVTP